ALAHQVEEGIDSLYAYAHEIIADHESAPREDFITSLIEVQREEGKLNADETAGAVVNLILGAGDNVAMQIASTSRALIEEDTWEPVRRDPELVSAAVEEGIRSAPIMHWIPRIAHEPTEFAGLKIPAGTTLVINTWANSRDPERFPEPDR